MIPVKLVPSVMRRAVGKFKGSSFGYPYGRAADTEPDVSSERSGRRCGVHAPVVVQKQVLGEGWGAYIRHVSGKGIRQLAVFHSLSHWRIAFNTRTHRALLDKVSKAE